MKREDEGGAWQILRLEDGRAIRVQIAGLASTKPAPTFASFAEEYMRTRAAVANAPATLEKKATELRLHLLPAFADTPIDAIDGAAVSALQAALLAKRLGAKSVNNVCSVLRTILRYAVELDVIRRVPRIQRMHVAEPATPTITADAATLLVAGADPEWRLAIMLCVRGGLRIGEVLALRWDAVDLDRGCIVVSRSRWKDHEGETKGKRIRRVTMSEPVHRAFEAHPHHPISPYVFAHESGEPFTRPQMRWPLWRACDAAAIPRMSYHRLRHTFATILVDRGVPLRRVQQLLGHSTVTMTERYTRGTDESLSDAIAVLDDDDK